MYNDATSASQPFSPDADSPSGEGSISAGDATTNGEAAVLQEVRRRRNDELAKIVTELERLETQRIKLVRDLLALDILLGREVNINAALSVDTARASQLESVKRHVIARSGSVRRHQPSEVLVQSVDAVLEVLRDHEPLHYREIYAKVAETGVIIPGKDPAATLLARFSRDPRVERISAGTYCLIQDAVAKDATAQ